VVFRKSSGQSKDWTQGTTMSGKEAKKLAKRGGLGDDGKVRDTRGRVTGDFSNRTRKQANENGV